MNKWINEVLSSFGIMLGIDITEANEVLGLVLVVLNIIILVLSFGIKTWSWTKESTKDGKITTDELKELEHLIEDTNNSITELLDKNKEN